MSSVSGFSRTPGVVHAVGPALPLLHAAEAGAVEAVRQLLTERTYSSRILDGAVQVACTAGRLDCLRLFAKEFPESLKVRTDAGWSLLHLAATGGRADTLRFLLGSGLTQDEDNDGWTPLHLALEGDHRECVGILKAEGVLRENAPTRDGRTLLHLAAKIGDLVTIEELLATGTTLPTDAGGAESPAAWAAVAGHVECLRRLCPEGGACPDSAVLLAAAGAEQPGGVRYLLGFYPKNGDRLNEALRHAIRAGRRTTARLFLTHGSDPDARDEKGRRAGFYAAERGAYACLSLLQKVGADLTGGDALGETPLHAASRNGHVQCLRLLLRHGADPNRISLNGETPLHGAARGARHDCILELVTAGASAFIKNRSGETPVCILHDASRGQALDSEWMQNRGLRPYAAMGYYHLLRTSEPAQLVDWAASCLPRLQRLVRWARLDAAGWNNILFTPSFHTAKPDRKFFLEDEFDLVALRKNPNAPGVVDAFFSSTASCDLLRWAGDNHARLIEILAHGALDEKSWRTLLERPDFEFSCRRAGRDKPGFNACTALANPYLPSRFRELLNAAAG